MTGADHLAEAIEVARRALEPFRGNPVNHLTLTSSSIATFCLHRVSALVQANAFDVAADLAVLASGYVLGIAGEIFKDPDARREGAKAIERVYGPAAPNDPPSPNNQLTADELRELGIEV